MYFQCSGFRVDGGLKVFVEAILDFYPLIEDTTDSYTLMKGLVENRSNFDTLLDFI